jgi:transcriptional regulator with XRE-family HTH domain
METPDYAEWIRREGGMARTGGDSDLRALRRASGMSQAALAAAVGVRPLVVGRWERGESAPVGEEAARLAQVLGIDPAEVARWPARVEPWDDPLAPPPEATVARGADPWGSAVSPGRTSRARLRGRLVRPPMRPAGAWAFPTRSARRVVRSYLDDPAERRRYALRLLATVLVMMVMVLVLIWALGQLGGAWGSFLDLFHRGEPSPAPGGAFVLLPTR